MTRSKIIIFETVQFIKKHYFFILMLLGILLGVTLRLYRINSQIIWDDEWHAIQIALFNPLKYIFTHFHWDYNSIPLTIYFRIMLESIGLNEIIIRLPQLLSGILMLVSFPLIIKKISNKTIALLFLFMLSISPLLIHFSRSALSFSTIVFLSLLSIFSFYLWLIESKKIYLIVYLASAVLTPYFHISSAVFVLAPILYISLLHLLKNKQSFIKKIPSKKHIIIISILLFVGISSWFLPAVMSMGPILEHSSQGYISLGTIGGCIFLFSGSKSSIMCLILFALFIYGVYVLYASNKLLFSYLFTICLSQLLFIIIPRPFLVQIPIIFARYFLLTLPVYLLIISFALNNLYIKLSLFLQKKTRLANTFTNLTMIILFFILFFKGPVLDAYSYPNDFTNHKDFQSNYLCLDHILKRATSHEGSYPQFYTSLKKRAQKVTLIEFPGIISWTWNIFHVYQRLHQNRVMVAYDSNDFGPFFGYGIVKNKNIVFRNFINIWDPRLLSSSGADFIILHKNIWKESVTVGFHPLENTNEMESKLSNLPIQLREKVREYVSKTNVNLGKIFGKPFFEDEWIIVYKIS